MKALRRAAQRARDWERRLDARTLTETDYRRALREGGFREGATVWVHSSADALRRRVPSVPLGRHLDLWLELLGPDGTLLMPTFPFVGSQAAYARSAEPFDSERSPSWVGLLTEVFRRRDDALRSLHPTHPVAGVGPRAQELLATHHEGSTFGETSPFRKLAAVGGTLVGVGVEPARSFTHLHALEEADPVAHQLEFESAPVVMQVVCGETLREVPVVPLREGRGRDYGRVVRLLTRRGVLRQRSPGGLRIATADAGTLWSEGLALLRAGRFYERSRLRRALHVVAQQRAP